MNRPTFRTHQSGAREVFAWAREDYQRAHDRSVIATCNTCGRSWDDAHASGVTPTPAGRCPFEYQHKPEPKQRRQTTRRAQLRPVLYGVSPLTIDFLNASRTSMETALGALTASQMQVCEKELTDIAQTATQRAAYLGHRGANGCGDCGHDLATTRAAQRVQKVRKALGFTYP